MIVWRISKASYAATAFKGTGAKKVGGRFNHPGSSEVVYAAGDCLALALVELWAHLPTPKTPPDCCYIRAEIPDAVSRQLLTENELPLNWDMFPHPDSTREIGTDWLAKKETCLLLVPSAITKVDFNCLINPSHPDFPLISVNVPVPFGFDDRL